MGLTKESQHKCGHPRIKMPEKKKRKKKEPSLSSLSLLSGQLIKCMVSRGRERERKTERERERVRETGRGASFFGSAAVDSFFFFSFKKNKFQISYLEKRTALITRLNFQFSHR